MDLVSRGILVVPFTQRRASKHLGLRQSSACMQRCVLSHPNAVRAVLSHHKTSMPATSSCALHARTTPPPRYAYRQASHIPKTAMRAPFLPAKAGGGCKTGWLMEVLPCLKHALLSILVYLHCCKHYPTTHTIPCLVGLLWLSAFSSYAPPTFLCVGLPRRRLPLPAVSATDAFSVFSIFAGASPGLTV